MKQATLGIKLADGTFFPITEESYRGKKKLVLTAALEGQKSVKVDLLRHTGDEATSVRLGTLAVLLPAGQGPADIEFYLEIDDQNRLTASAGLAGSEDIQTLNLDLSDFSSGDEVLDDSGEEDAPRSDKDILSDDSLAGPGDLDSFDSFDLESPGETSMTLEAPSLDSEDLDLGQPKSDQEILADEDLAASGLDDLSAFETPGGDDFEFPLSEPETDHLSKAAGLTPASEGSPEDSLDDFTFETLDDSQPGTTPTQATNDDFSLDGLDDLHIPKAASGGDDFSLDGLDDLDTPKAASGGDDFSLDGLDDLDAPKASSGGDDFSLDGLDDLDAPKAANGGDDFSFDSLDDLGDSGKTDTAFPGLDSLGDLDEGFDQPTKTKSKETSGFDTGDMDSLGSLDGMDLDSPGDLGDLSSGDFSLDSAGLNSGEPEDHFELPEPGRKPPVAVEPEPPVAEKTPREKKKKQKPVIRTTEQTPMDKAALVFSLVTLSLLVTTILALLFFNMLKPAPAPVPPKQVSTATSNNLSLMESHRQEILEVLPTGAHGSLD